MSLSPQDAVEGLAQVLTTESRAYSELVALAKEEQSALRSRDVFGLLKTLDDQRNVLTHLGQLERNRLGCVSGAAKALALSDDASLRSVADRAAPPHAGRLAALREEILGHIAVLSTLNRQNAILLSSSLELTRATLGYLAHGSGSHSVYGPRGGNQREAGQVASLVLDRPA